MPDIVATDCGGCQGLGSHKRWCRQVVGLGASVYGPMAAQLNTMGDRVGPNNMGLSNRLWALSADVESWAKSLAEEFDSRPHPVG